MLDITQKYIILDAETEGLNLKYSRPWEFSFLLCQGGRILKKEELYVDVPNLDLPAHLKKLCGFDPHKYNSIKRPAVEVWDKIKKYLYDSEYKVIGQNILGFDIFILAILAEMAGEKIDYSFVDRILDTRPLAVAHRCGIEKPRNGSLIEWQYKILNDRSLKAKASQSALLKLFNIPHDPKRLHEGLYDTEMTWEVFKQLRKVLEL